MQPSLAIINSLAELLAEDTAFLADAAVKNAHLMLAPFTPSPSYAFDSGDEATFDGYAVKTAAAGAQQFFTDALTGERVTQMIEPAGGWHWQTTGLTNLPQTIYGVVLTNDDDTVTHGSMLFDTPVELTGVGDAIDVDQLRFTFAAAPLS